ncbi:glycosyltransferase family 4 protein [Cytobacillus purgationiresistens]|uniref:Glycosyltransferase involved in cell wall biosynthesis n=1 Tax=Cytobacillus purgationiresistens TaxID=863449 RepID=A0ABU0AEP0_9BACI|nr:glycosyltransferase family 4 protein [Cytobacillus purgationiresistens]MDQ0269726.1 glycosyltransferase involved in cell wall biosynthesis [Cytobacillus purgationiresistens]
MNILLATFWQVPHTGGVWKYMLQLKERLEVLGHSVDLLGYGKDHKFVHLVNKNQLIDVSHFAGLINIIKNEPPLDPVIKMYDNLRLNYEEAVKTLDLNQYDLIHTQDVVSSSCINKIRPKHTSMVATLHGCVAHEIIEACYADRLSEKSLNGIRYFHELEFEGASSADCTVVANRWMQNILTEEFKVNEEQISTLHYGYDIESFLQKMKEPAKMKAPKNKKILLYTGRLAEFKGIHHLIDALYHLKKLRSDWVCWIAGDGPKQTDLQKQTQLLGLQQHIQFLGSRDDIPSLLSISDMLILPTLIENQPLSVIEAQISGTAVIVSAVGGVPEIIEHGMTGILVPPKDELMLFAHINYLLQEDQFRFNLGQRAKEWALEHWSLDQSVSKLLTVYYKAIALNHSK